KKYPSQITPLHASVRPAPQPVVGHPYRLHIVPQVSLGGLESPGGDACLLCQREHLFGGDSGAPVQGVQDQLLRQGEFGVLTSSAEQLVRCEGFVSLLPAERTVLQR